MKSESQMWRTMRDNINKVNPAAILRRIETGMTNVGFPDVYYAMNGVTGLIELKVVKETPKRPETTMARLKISEDQIDFIGQVVEHNPHTYVYVQVGAGYDKKQFYLFSGIHAAKLKTWTLAEWEGFAHGHWQGRPDYDEMVELLSFNHSVQGSSIPRLRRR